MSNYQKQLKELELKIYRNVIWGIGILLGLVVVVILLSGCVSQQTLIRHPVTNDVKYCESRGVGWLGVPLALIMQQECIDKYKNLGYEEER